tara:strand:- start:1520 stop:1660 length:141 start_codon:yes stop_codon:yes gene_type:complete
MSGFIETPCAYPMRELIAPLYIAKINSVVSEWLTVHDYYQYESQHH